MSYLFLDGAKLKQAVRNAKRLVKLADAAVGEHDVILTTGLSGDIVGSHVAAAMKKRHVVLRKKGVSTHGERIENGMCLWRERGEQPKVLILDDFISTGATLVNILCDAMLNADLKWKADEVTVALYAPKMRNPLGTYIVGNETPCQRLDEMFVQYAEWRGGNAAEMALNKRLRTRTHALVWEKRRSSPSVVRMALSVLPKKVWVEDKAGVYRAAYQQVTQELVQEEVADGGVPATV